jgi:NADH-quinone oxidoreductase subunit N
MSSFFCILVSFDYLKSEKINMFEYNVLILFAVFGLLCFISSYDLVSLYLALEVQSLSFYILTTIKKDSAFSTEAGLKYFILGAFSSGLLLFGISLVYGFTGTTNFEILGKLLLQFDLNEFYNNIIHLNFGLQDRLALGMVFIMIGLLFKLTAAPFHMWAPDVYEGAPTSISLFFAVVPKIGILSIFIKLFYGLFLDYIELWQSITMCCGFFSVLVGTLGALQQYKIKRFLAFSSISHVGYLLIGFSTGTSLGVQSILFYMVVYAVMTLNVWAIVILLEIKKKETVRVRYITDLQQLSKNNMLLSITFMVNMFSMAGVPPLAGFYAKAFVFFGAFKASLYILTTLGILLSVVSAFYYIRFIKIIFFDTYDNNLFYVQNIDYKKAYTLGITFFFISFFALRSNSLIILMERMELFINI